MADGDRCENECHGSMWGIYCIHENAPPLALFLDKDEAVAFLDNGAFADTCGGCPIDYAVYRCGVQVIRFEYGEAPRT